MQKRHQRGKGERGLAIVMTGLVLLPLMVFAAFGVDMASWYSRISYLQKSADAASLAGTVWMPDLNKATVEATASLRSNGLVDGVDGIEIEVVRGSTATSLRVIVTDTDADRFFSQVFRGKQTLSRSAEAEYNLPIPLGSPLNFFGGDRTKTNPAAQSEWRVSWPGGHPDSSWGPNNPNCNVGTSSGQGLGRWTGSWQSGHSGSTQCRWSPRTNTISSDPGFGNRLPPTNAPCNRHGSQNGRWESSSTYSASQRYSGSNTGNRQCTWLSTDSATHPPNATSSANRPLNRPCNLPALGRWSTSNFTNFESNVYFTGSASNGNRICEWNPILYQEDVTPPNPIEAGRTPGFWAAIGGPGDVSAFGDAYSARCTGNTNCGGSPNQMYSDEGYWYVIKMPASGATTTSVQIFDAAYNSNASSTTLTGDTRGDFPSRGFTTTYSVWRQPNPLDFGSKTKVASSVCPEWNLRDESTYRLQWVEMCQLPAANGAIYLLNVRTHSEHSTSDGVNGYAVQAISSGVVQPAVYAYGSMGMRNNIDAGEAKFYLAEVGPQYAGKTLVVELFDSGDASGNAYLRPVMPGTAVGDFTNVPSSWCSYTSSPAPNPGIFSGSPAGERTSSPVSTPTTPSLTNCRIQTTSSGTQQFNDNWLSIRVAIPSDYTCTLGVNPEVNTGSCWWGIKYNFSDSSNDVTTWRARIEGNPLHLTE